MLWVFGRHATHIGASGLAYGFASFLFFSGIIRRYFRLIALSLLVVFLYGSMVWGMFPHFYVNVSWEGHAMGFVSGIIMAIWYRKEGPQQPVYDWMVEDEEDSGQVVQGSDESDQETGRRNDEANEEMGNERREN